MKRHLLFITCIFCLTISAQDRADAQRHARMTPEEFQNNQKEFIAHYAELTEEESTAFFPLYYELQDKKHQANARVWKKARAVKPQERSEEVCNEMIEALADVKIECATLEKEYLQKFKKILPAKKLMRVQMAEDRFQREILRSMQQERDNKKQ